MSARASLLAAVAVLSFFAGVTGIRLAYTLAYVLLLTLAVALGWSVLAGRRIELRRESPEGAYSVGEPFHERFTVRNRGALPVAYCEVHDRSTLIGYVPARAFALGAGDTVRWSAGGVFSRRGRHHFGPLEARLGDPFGLFPRTVRVEAQRSVVVYPALHPLDELGTLWSGGSPGDVARGRVIDVPPDVATVREYQPEDGLGRIHWASTARTGRLMSRTYDTHTSADLLVILDLAGGFHAGTPPESSLEYAISLAASICHAAVRRGQAVGLVTNDALGTAFGAGRGESQRLRILDYLALADADGSVAVAETIDRQGQSWRGRGGLVVITASQEREWVEALLDAGVRGQRHLAVHVDPVSFGAPGTPLRLPAAWRLPLDWWVVRRGDALVTPRQARAASR